MAEALDNPQDTTLSQDAGLNEAFVAFENTGDTIDFIAATGDAGLDDFNYNVDDTQNNEYQNY